MSTELLTPAHTYKYVWKVGKKTYTGTKVCESKAALRQHIIDVGGKLIEIIEIDGE